MSEVCTAPARGVVDLPLRFLKEQQLLLGELLVGSVDRPEAECARERFGEGPA
jgi:hypothetical protein